MIAPGFGLPSERNLGIVGGMKRCLLPLGLLVPLFWTGCAGSGGKRPPEPLTYSRVTVASFRTRPIAEYIAEGKVRKEEDGYRFTAVERTIFSPHRINIRYPIGRPVTVVGSHVIIKSVEKPAWLQRLDETR